MASEITPMNGKFARLRAFAVLILIIAGLWMLDWSLARTELLELEAEARRTFLEGSHLLAEGKPENAIEPLRRAHALDRRNTDYELTLVDALVAAGNSDEAWPLLDEILQRESNNGRANLTAARLMAKEGKTGPAESYYHRAIYGEWPGQAGPSRRSARMELIAFLIKQKKNAELLSELLALQAQSGTDDALQKRIGHLLLEAGSAQHAADAYRSLIGRHPGDADLYAGLAEAELMQGQYRPAVAAFVAAFRHRPGDLSLRKRMEFASLMAGLDPTPRQLPSMEKYRRSLRILEMVQTAYDRCRASQGKQAAEQQSSTKEYAPAHVTNEAAEENLTLAEQLWQTRINECGASTSVDEEPVRLLMAKIAQ